MFIARYTTVLTLERAMARKDLVAEVGGLLRLTCRQEHTDQSPRFGVVDQNLRIGQDCRSLVQLLTGEQQALETQGDVEKRAHPQLPGGNRLDVQVDCLIVGFFQ